jgi:hypothetical protein
VDEPLVGDRPLDKLGLLGVRQMLDVLPPAGAQVIEDQHPIAARHERIRQVRADEIRASRDQVIQASPSRS